jgi:Uma2 family endonuclease
MYEYKPPHPSSETLPERYDLPREDVDDMYDPNLPIPPWETLPTMYDLPSELVGESGLPDEFHRIQAELLSETCQPPQLSVDDEVFIASDLNLYYDLRHTQWYKRPDWFLALGVSRFTQQQELRLSYVTWQEKVTPFLVVELLSPGTENDDLGQKLREVNKPPTKWQVYERILRIPHYVVYDRYSNHLRAFELQGSNYQALDVSSRRIWFEEMQLGLGLWQGDYQQTNGLWLRWYGANGWVPTLVEKAEQERQRALEAELQAASERDRAFRESQRAEAESQRAEAESQRAEAESQRAERLAEYLRSQGIDPDNLPSL